MLKFIGWLSMTMLCISSWALVAHGVLRWVSAENDHVNLVALSPEHFRITIWILITAFLLRLAVDVNKKLDTKE